ncbi:MAG: serpin family protein [Polyangiaceae bacterium]
MQLLRRRFLGLPLLFLPAACADSWSTASAPVSPPPATPAEVESFAASSNAFGLELYRQITGSDNLVLSPLSLSIALTMAYGGAQGETAKEMANVLHLSSEVDKARAAAGNLLAELSKPREDGELRLVNRLFGDESAGFKEAFIQSTRDAFGAPLEPVDFIHDAESTRKRINAWAEHQTKDRIKDLLPEGSINAATRLVLVNAIYLLADWAAPFEKEDTSDGAFTKPDKQPVVVPMMHSGAHPAGYAEVADVKLLDLPYKGDALSMTFVLPNDFGGLPAVESGLDAAKLAEWVKALQPARPRVALPKIELDPATALTLKSSLAALGMRAAFQEDRADLGRMANQRLSIAEVVQKSYLRIDEKGTEAAAATAILTKATSAVMTDKEFIADHPFLFFLRDRASGAILFMGRVTDPSRSG